MLSAIHFFRIHVEAETRIRSNRLSCFGCFLHGEFVNFSDIRNLLSRQVEKEKKKKGIRNEIPGPWAVLRVAIFIFRVLGKFGEKASAFLNEGENFLFFPQRVIGLVALTRHQTGRKKVSKDVIQ